MFSDFLQGPITLVGPLVKAIAFLLRCQIYSGLSAFQTPTTLPGMGCWLMLQVCLGWHFLSGHCSRKLVSALKLNSRSMCWTVHFTLNKGWTELLKVIYFKTAGPHGLSPTFLYLLGTLCDLLASYVCWLVLCPLSTCVTYVREDLPSLLDPCM